MEVVLRTLTPLWTGDVDQRCLEVKETGIIGSLRWWYEALVRGYGGRACDPTNSKCDGKEHCEVCELFGCTGWSRKFKIEVDPKLDPIKPLRISTREKRRIRGQLRFLSRFVSGLLGELDMRIIPTRSMKESEMYNLYKTLQLVHGYAALGAKTSQGNGVVCIEKPDEFQYVPATSDVVKRSYKINSLPNMADFFFSKFRLRFENSIRALINRQRFWGIERNAGIWVDFWSNYRFLPIAFHTRDALRPVIRDRGRRYEVFGRGGRGSKVFVSHGYRIDDSTVEIRMFGYSLKKEEIDVLRSALPEMLPKCLSRDPQEHLKIQVYETEFKTGRELL